MNVNLKRMTGEELLLASVLRGSQLQPAIDEELDRRSWSGPVTAPKRRRRRGGMPVAARPATQRVA